MLILPEDKVIVVATPRTGSRSMVEAILSGEPEGVIKTRLHHDWPHEVAAAKEKGYEVWTLIREPISQLKSWISHCGCWITVDDFIETYRSRYFFYQGGMNIYNQEADRYFIMERNGLERMLAELTLKNKPKIKHIGPTDSSGRRLTDKQEELAKRRFDNDFKLYNKLWEEDTNANKNY